MKRHSDRTRLIRSSFGAAIVVGALAFRFFGKPGSDWLILALVLVGAGMVSPSFVVDLVRIWRGNGPTPPPPPGPSS